MECGYSSQWEESVCSSFFDGFRKKVAECVTLGCPEQNWVKFPFREELKRVVLPGLQERMKLDTDSLLPSIRVMPAEVLGVVGVRRWKVRLRWVDVKLPRVGLPEASE